jgi:hypothetical protein
MSTALQCACGGEFVDVHGRLACAQCGASLMSLATAEETQTIVAAKGSDVEETRPEPTDPLISELAESLVSRRKKYRSNGRKTSPRRRRRTKRAAVEALHASVSVVETGTPERLPDAESEFGNFFAMAMSEAVLSGPLSAGATRRMFQDMFDVGVSAQVWADAGVYAAGAADHELLRLMLIVEIDEVDQIQRAKCVGQFAETNPVVFLTLRDAHKLWKLAGGLDGVTEHWPAAINRLTDGISVRNSSGRAILVEICEGTDSSKIETAQGVEAGKQPAL